jgi:hypothetical protein
VSSNPWELIVSSAVQAIKDGAFFDICRLSSAHKTKVLSRFNSARPRSSVRLGDMTLTSEDGSDLRAAQDFAGYTSGFSTWVSLMAKDPSALFAVGDRLQWLESLKQFPCRDDRPRLNLARNWHIKYPSFETSWVSKWGEDSTLVIEHLLGNLHNAGHKRQLDEDFSEPRRDRKRTSPSICRSRFKPSMPACVHGAKCRFSHKCASCGADHESSRCPNWDQKKADAAKEASNSR